MSDGASQGRTSRDHLEPHLASQNRVLGIGPCKALSRRPNGLSCGALLFYDLRPSAARSACFPPGLRLDWASPASRRLAEPILNR
ncbi:MAG: hypothetical protein JSR39_03405 [Verrucomicrobia bacterium]|nr:hypothetical protein [Verrucomicrobiota bacterium]